MNKVRWVMGTISAFLLACPQIKGKYRHVIGKHALKIITMIAIVVLMMLVRFAPLNNRSASPSYAVACPVLFAPSMYTTATAFESGDFTYTGSYVWVQDDADNWRLKLLTSGTFTPTKKVTIDIFIVGGGGGGANGGGRYGGGGGAGGYTGTWTQVTINKGQAYQVVIGAGGAAGSIGGTSSAFGGSVSGGNGGNSTAGGSGGSGGGGSSGYNSGSHAGAGGSDGSAGDAGVTGTGSGAGGSGQGSTTREFAESTGTLYSGAGSGGVHQYGETSWVRAGGAGGGGQGGAPDQNGTAGTANLGGGGGGGAGYNKAGGHGGSGICIIRNAR